MSIKDSTAHKHPSPMASWLDHYLAQRKEPLSIDKQLDLMRQISEAVRFAYEQRVIHRGRHWFPRMEQITRNL